MKGETKVDLKLVALSEASDADTLVGQVACTLEPGGLQFSLAEIGNIPWEEVDLDVLDLRHFSPWQNDLRWDINADSLVTPVDLLILINNINAYGARELPIPMPPSDVPPFLDPTGDGTIASDDLLELLTYLNESVFGLPASGESEPGRSFSSPQDAEGEWEERGLSSSPTAVYGSDAWELELSDLGGDLDEVDAAVAEIALDVAEQWQPTK